MIVRNYQLRDFYSATNTSTITVTKWKWIRWFGHAARMGVKKNVFRILLRKTKKIMKIKQLEALGV
jgi:hypothetical protein